MLIVNCDNHLEELRFLKDNAMTTHGMTRAAARASPYE